MDEDRPLSVSQSVITKLLPWSIWSTYTVHTRTALTKKYESRDRSRAREEPRDTHTSSSAAGTASHTSARSSSRRG